MKFRNAVKRATTLGVSGKNEYRRFVVVITPTDVADVYRVTYRGGDHAKNAERELEQSLRLAQDLHLAGFEMVEYQDRTWGGELVTRRGYRKAA
jgi:hypothetical protein